VKRVFGDEAKQKRVLDSSNGVARDIFADIKKSVSSIVDISLLKNDKDLNEDCGSDFIKSKRELPAGISASTSESASEGKKLAISTENGSLDGSTFLCAFDGDADRMIYLKPSSNQLIDGDRLCVLFASFLNHLLSLSNVNSEITTVVTDYTNGAAVSELKTKGTVKVAGTGVKNMQKASNNAVTVWFESNGHGTACFSGEIYNEIKNKLGYSENICLLDMPESALLNEMDQLLCRPSTTLSTKDPSKRSPYNELFRKLTEQESLLLLHSLSDIFDPYIGDAIVNMLISECIFYSGFVLPDVLLGVYQDMPNLLTSVAGRRDRLNELLIQSIKANYSDARIHLRASGTEDIIRIYVEGECEEKLRSIVENIKITLSEL
ncbi:phosphoacetylglucosamine mutase, partial [Nematocida minor]|uniref:phosphoacetylglucosamine mutase n=1 Tax=Nematocida minor TaxID=1912983 RepID=UPI00222028C7